MMTTPLSQDDGGGSFDAQATPRFRAYLDKDYDDPRDFDNLNDLCDTYLDGQFRG